MTFLGGSSSRMRIKWILQNASMGKSTTIVPMGRRTLLPPLIQTATYNYTTNNRFDSFNTSKQAAATAWSTKRSFSKLVEALEAEASKKTKENELPPPLQHQFRKVLIANRGEIAIRVARTCRRLGISTVSVFASNDDKSMHVEKTDECFRLGLNSEGAAYTDSERLCKAIEQVGADAVHPGYGFLSENADFANAVQNLTVEKDGKQKKVAWLGPPAQAIVDMGCKLRSKDIARDANVAIIPGCDDGALDSVDEALELMRSKTNGLEYPVLLKAAAGGGGKGMRICRSDKELIEGYPLAESEGLKFFADGRLLLEQYLENPHHIEFQVVCSKTEDTDKNKDPIVDVAIFVERECSIQRRNQKVVEESPSCLLTEETRRQMMEQTALLCQKVGYEGAGTVEWLVVDNKKDGAKDSAQKFYFLEMNTRLQVEHPITEAVSYNVDLVEAMLDVGAGQGLPKEWYNTAKVVETSNDSKGKLLIMPWKGHSIEGRIYAENPLRGYLPSTGPLLPYKEPTQAVTVSDGSSEETIPDCSDEDSSYLRLDSGVAEGHRVTPFYDPMISKIISYAPTREAAIEVLSKGLDSYVIGGIQHNARLIQAVLRHPLFQSGKTPTSFLEKEIPDFSEYHYNQSYANTSGSSLLSNAEEEELAVAIAVISREREIRLGRPPVVSKLGEGGLRTVVIRLDGIFGKVDPFVVSTIPGVNQAKIFRLVGEDDSKEGERMIDVELLDMDLVNYLTKITIDGKERTIQVSSETMSGELKVQMYGAEYADCLIQRSREYELSKYMLPPVIADTSNMVMSPMPGTLISFSKGLSVGDSIEEGQELCVIEAMKMQNIIRAPREGVISKLCMEEGATLVTDDVIIELEASGNNDVA